MGRRYFGEGDEPAGDVGGLRGGERKEGGAALGVRGTRKAEGEQDHEQDYEQEGVREGKEV